MKNLKIIREKRGLTQTELGAIVGVTQQGIDRYEKGQSQPSCDTLRALAKALDTSADYLLGLTDNDAPAYHINENELNADEAFMLNEYRGFNDVGKQFITTTMEGLNQIYKDNNKKKNKY